MKYIKKFNEDTLKIEPILSLCRLYDIDNFIINDDGTVDVKGSVTIFRRGLKKIPLKFGIVEQHFTCCQNIITSLHGSPYKTIGSFDCSDNKLTTLIGCSKEIGRDFHCNNNKLTTLVGGPEKVGGMYGCHSNKLLSLDGLPEKKIPWRWTGNPIFRLYEFFHRDYDIFKDSLDYNYLRGDCIIKLRFAEACEEAGIKMPIEPIWGYKYI